MGMVHLQNIYMFSRMFLINLEWFAHLLGVTALHLASLSFSAEDATAGAATQIRAPCVRWH